MMKDRLACESGVRALGSPFNFPEQVELHLFRSMPDPSANPQAYEAAVLEKLPEYLERDARQGVRAVHERTRCRAAARC